MTRRLSQIWQHFRESFSVQNQANTTIEAGRAVLTAAKTIKEQAVSLAVLQSLLQNSSAFLDVLCLPLTEVVAARSSFLPLGIVLLRFHRQITRRQISLEEWIFIISQVAFLESVSEILSLYPSVNWRPQLNIIEVVIKRLEKLNNLELDHQSATDTLLCFHQSNLAIEFKQIFCSRLQATLNQKAINRLVQRIVFNTHRYLIKSCLNSGSILENMPLPPCGSWQQEEEKFQSIDKYLKECIAQQLQEKVFTESFFYKDIYIPLKAKVLDFNGEETEVECDLKTWAEKILDQARSNTQSQLMFIQSDPGRGKTIFCKMFADWVRLNLYPRWIPILISVQDITSFEESFEHTIAKTINRDFANNISWLTDENTRFLFLLDGFDELLLEGKINTGLKDFIQQVVAFQEHYGGHQVLITGRTLALQGIEELLPEDVQRVAIQLMDEQLQQQWLDKWSTLAGVDEAIALQQFLQDTNLPESVRKLSTEPLLLYLLAAMYRDGNITGDMFQNVNESQGKLLIYQKFFDWLITKQYPDFLNLEITGLGSSYLQQILEEAGLCVIQSGGRIASMSMIEERIKVNKSVQTLIAQASNSEEEQTLRQALAAFDLKQSPDGKTSYVGFAHKSFGEFLCARKLAATVKDWTELGSGNQGVMDEQIYDLLGYGGLTPEIVGYLMDLLKTSGEFKSSQLSPRLQDFYTRWCQGEFIDSVTITLPQLKAQELQKYNIMLGQRQVDIYAGLNVMILLLELHRDPSGQLPTEHPWRLQLLRTINYSDSWQVETFKHILGQYLFNADLRGNNLRGVELRGLYLRGVNLEGVYLCGADLKGVYLRGANLSGTNLSGANLTAADLTGANLTGAYLSGANLKNANLSGANLRGVDLRGAYLRLANLSGADLRDAYLSGAYLSGASLSNEFFGDIQWDEYTNWEDVQGLDTAVNVPQALQQQLGLS